MAAGVKTAGMKGPIIDFKTNAAVKESMAEWQHRLYLDDWIIKALLVDGTEIPNNRAETSIVFTHKSAVIKLARITEDMSNRIVRQCHEVSLVHELLHCKYDLDIFEDTWEGRYAGLYVNMRILSRWRDL